jgi:hypothetical protein
MTPVSLLVSARNSTINPETEPVFCDKLHILKFPQSTTPKTYSMEELGNLFKVCELYAREGLMSNQDASLMASLLTIGVSGPSVQTVGTALAAASSSSSAPPVEKAFTPAETVKSPAAETKVANDTKSTSKSGTQAIPDFEPAWLISESEKLKYLEWFKKLLAAAPKELAENFLVETPSVLELFKYRFVSFGSSLWFHPTLILY